MTGLPRSEIDRIYVKHLIEMAAQIARYDFKSETDREACMNIITVQRMLAKEATGRAEKQHKQKLIQKEEESK